MEYRDEIRTITNEKKNSRQIWIETDADTTQEDNGQATGQMKNIENIERVTAVRKNWWFKTKNCYLPSLIHKAFPSNSSIQVVWMNVFCQ